MVAVYASTVFISLYDISYKLLVEFCKAQCVQIINFPSTQNICYIAKSAWAWVEIHPHPTQDGVGLIRSLYSNRSVTQYSACPAYGVQYYTMFD